MSLRERMLVFFGLLFAATIVTIELVHLYGIPFTHYAGEYRIRQEEVYRNLGFVSDLKKGRVIQWLNQQRNELNEIAEHVKQIRPMSTLPEGVGNHPSGRFFGKRQINEWKGGTAYRELVISIEPVLKTHPIYKKIELVDGETGTILVSSEEKEIGKNISGHDHFIRVKQFVSSEVDVGLTKEGGVFYIVLSRLFRNKGSESRGRKNSTGIVNAYVKAEDILTPMLHTGEGLGHTGEALLVDQNTRIITRLKYRLPDGSVPMPMKFRIKAKPAVFASRGSEGIIGTRDYRGVEVLAAYRYIPINSEFGWGLVVKKNRDEVFSPLERLITSAFIIGTISILVVLGITLMISNTLAYPITNLSTTAQRVESGDLGARAEVSGSQETRTLGTVFNSMVEKIKSSHEDLENKVWERTLDLREANLALQTRNRINDIFLTLPNDEVYNGVLDVILEVMESKFGVFGYIDDEGALVVPSMTRHIWDECEVEEKKFIFPQHEWGSSTWPVAIREKRAIYLNRASVKVPDGHIPIERHISLPIIYQDKSIGLFQVANKKTDYDEKDVALLTSIADHIAPILSARLERDREEKMHKEFEKALTIEKERLAVTLRAIGDGVIATDREGNIVLINKVGEELTGWNHDEAIGKPLTKVFHIIHQITRKQCENPVEKVLAKGVIIGLANHTVLISKDGTERILADSGAPIRDMDSKIIGVVLVFRDVTLQARLEAERHRSQKLESLGVLAGGIAHDFNNLLTVILGNVSLAKTETLAESKAHKNLIEAERAIIRTKDLTAQLLTFARGGAPVKKVFSLKKLIDDASRFSLRGSNVSCTISLADDLYPVEADEGQIGQTLNNLLINADQAMPQGGTVEIRGENITLGKRTSLPLDEGTYVKISVKDQGIGIQEEHLSNIFDPYFTTKQEGSGLGLASAHSIIKKHDGYISVESIVGAGTTFHIYLHASEGTVPEEEHEDDVIFMGEGRVLLMDDEEIVRNAAEGLLESLGYEVILVPDGGEAIRLYGEAINSGNLIDVVILDLTVPGGMGGKEAILKLLEIDPDVKVIVSSGYSSDPIMANFREYNFKGCLAKPYRLVDLATVLQEVLVDSEL